MLSAFAHWLNQFCVWLDQTPLSQTIQTQAWIVPTVQTVHILAIALVATSALMIDLRVIGIVGRDQPMARVGERFLPFVWWPLLVLLATGAIMIICQPARALRSGVFQLKMALVVVAMIVTFILQGSLSQAAVSERTRGAAPAMAIVSILLWVGIICAGRWIAYSYVE